MHRKMKEVSNMKFPRYGFAVLFGLALFVFTGYLLADTFLIRRVYTVVTEETDTKTAEVQTSEETEAIAIVASEPGIVAMMPSKPLSLAERTTSGENSSLYCTRCSCQLEFCSTKRNMPFRLSRPDARAIRTAARTLIVFSLDFSLCFMPRIISNQTR